MIFLSCLWQQTCFTKSRQLVVLIIINLFTVFIFNLFCKIGLFMRTTWISKILNLWSFQLVNQSHLLCVQIYSILWFVCIVIVNSKQIFDLISFILTICLSTDLIITRKKMVTCIKPTLLLHKNLLSIFKPLTMTCYKLKCLLLRLKKLYCTIIELLVKLH